MATGPQVLTAALGPADLAACVALDRASLDGLWSPSQWSVELADPKRPGLGLWLRGELVAMACGWRILDELHVTLVAVIPSRRRQGLGRRALAQLLTEAATTGAATATLEVAAGNHAARGLYEAMGFRTAGVRRGYYRSGEDALIQWRSLTEDLGEGPRKVRVTG